MIFAIAVTLALTTVAVGTCDFAGAEHVVADVNVHRAGARLPALAVDPLLTAVAMDRAADLLRRHYFAHVSPDGTTAIDELRTRAVPIIATTCWSDTTRGSASRSCARRTPATSLSRSFRIDERSVPKDLT